MAESEFKSIKNWSEDERPREKLIAHGRQVLSNAELIAILLATGTKNKSAIDVAKDILSKVNGDMNALGRLTVKQLCNIDGIGPAKAVTLIAAMELGMRRDLNEVNEKYKIGSSRDIYNLMKPKLQDLLYEQFWIITLSRANQVIESYKISEGGISTTTVDPKKIFKIALEDSASGVILAHNHPSGNLSPSQQDIRLTKRLQEAGYILDIAIIDHLIVGATGFFSFSDDGKL